MNYKDKTEQQINDEQIEDGRKIADLIRMEGWQVYKARIEREIKDEYELIRDFPIEGRSLQEIAAEYLTHRESLNAYERALGFIDEFLKNIK